MSRSSLQHWFPILAVLGSVTALALGTSYAKQLFPIIGAQGTSALRVGFSALIVLSFWRPWRWQLNRRDAGAILRYGIVLGCMNLMFYMAIRTIPFGVAVAIEFCGPLAVALWSSRRWTNYVWAAFAVLGLSMLLPLHTGGQRLDPTGVAFAFGAAICWGAYIVFGKRASHLHSGHVVSLGLLAAALIVMPVGVAHAGMALLDPTILAMGLVAALVSSAIPMSLEMYALKHLPKETFGIMTSVEPAIAAMIAWPLLGERLSSQQWLAIMCTVVAAAGAAMTARREPAGAAQPDEVSQNA
ncbi:MAG: DMT family transporter [Rhodocyclaceae bacterium]